MDGFSISHLYFADDFIVFTNASLNSTNKLMDFLQTFCIVSGLSLNKSKSFFIASNKAHHVHIITIKGLIGFMQGHFPIKCLGVLLFKGRNKLFSLMNSMHNKLTSWDSNFLSFGGRLTLIRSGLCSLPIYIFQTLKPTCAVCNKIDKLFN